MARSTHTVWINCDAADLFAVLMDPEANRRWQTGVVETRATCSGPADVGTTMHEVREVAGYRAMIEYRLVELEWPRRAVVRVVDGPLRGSASYSCRPARWWHGAHRLIGRHAQGEVALSGPSAGRAAVRRAGGELPAPQEHPRGTGHHHLRTGTGAPGHVSGVT